jgi:hypothetical protein
VTNSRVLIMSYLHAQWHANSGKPQICWSNYRMQWHIKIWSLIIVWSENIAIQVIFENILFLGLGSYFWRKKNKSQESLPKSAARITKSLYSGGSTPISESAYAYVRSGLASYSVSGSESTISPIINLN